MWVPPEIKDPVLMHAPTRKSVACFGAVNLGTGKFVRAKYEKFDAVTFEGFLKRLPRHRSRGKRMVVVLDNARYHDALLLAPLLRRYRNVLRLFRRTVRTVGTHRTRLEAGPADGNTQSILRHLGRTTHCGRAMLRPLATIQFGAAQIMRHYLRRYV